MVVGYFDYIIFIVLIILNVVFWKRNFTSCLTYSISILRIIKEIFDSVETLKSARAHERAFTRKRNMPFSNALYFMLDMRKTTLQTRLNAFWMQNGGGKPISQQAFSKGVSRKQ